VKYPGLTFKFLEMKKTLFFCITLLIGVSLFAQLPKVTTKIKSLSALSPGSIVTINPTLTDTILNGDTIFYKVLVNHDIFVTPYISLLHKKPGSRDTTSAMTYWQSVDGKVAWHQITKGKAQSVYSLLLDTTSINNGTVGNTGHEISFLRDTAYFESQYLGIRIISNGATSAGKKAYYKPIYYGSIRINKK
jgi:hypothetical protein